MDASRTEPVTSPRLTLGPQEVADQLGMSYSRAQSLMKANRIRCADLGAGTRRFLRTCQAWLDEFLESGPRPDSEVPPRPPRPR